jgi:hypothetical protein
MGGSVWMLGMARQLRIQYQGAIYRGPERSDFLRRCGLGGILEDIRASLPKDRVADACLLLAKERWLEIELAAQPKGPPVKIEITQRLRHQTARSRQWIADRQGMGSSSYVSNLLGSVDSRL